MAFGPVYKILPEDVIEDFLKHIVLKSNLKDLQLSLDDKKPHISSI